MSYTVYDRSVRHKVHLVSRFAVSGDSYVWSSDCRKVTLGPAEVEEGEGEIVPYKEEKHLHRICSRCAEGRPSIWNRRPTRAKKAINRLRGYGVKAWEVSDNVLRVRVEDVEYLLDRLREG
jgi:hypothetical protein